MSNLTIFFGPMASGKTTKLRQLVQSYEERGAVFAFCQGETTEAGVRMFIAEHKPELVAIDDADDKRFAIFLKLAREFPSVQFAVARQAGS